MKEKVEKVIVIAGPTASGKSNLAIRLAKEIGGEIISADSRQVYQELTIGTAKVLPEEQQGIPHHLIDICELTKRYSAAQFVADAQGIIMSLLEKGKVPIVCGGTGFYIHSLLYGLDPIPDVPQSVLEKVELELEEFGHKYLQEELKSKDPEYYNKIDLANTHRLIRAISVIRYTGQPFSSYHSLQKNGLANITLPILLQIDRQMLYDRINIRVDQMISNGLVDEVKKLKSYWHLPSLQTVGYQELIAHFNGKHSFEEAIRLVKRNSRRYAKRQITWFNNHGSWIHIDGLKESGLETIVNLWFDRN